MTLKMKSTTNKFWKGWKLAWYHHFIHIACAKKVERVTEKIGCTSCEKWTISVEVSGFWTKTHLLQKAFHFFTWNCSDILDQRHHHNSCGEKVFTFSSLVSFAYCAVTMDNLHRLTLQETGDLPSVLHFAVSISSKQMAKTNFANSCWWQRTTNDKV